MDDLSPTKILELRKLRSFTQRKLAEILQISLKSLSNYELGHRTPDGLTFYKLSCISPNEELAVYFFRRAGLTDERLSDLASEILTAAGEKKTGPEYLKYMTHPGVVIAGKEQERIDLISKVLWSPEAIEELILQAEIVRIVMRSPGLRDDLKKSWVEFSVKLIKSSEKEALIKLLRILRSGRHQTKAAIQAHIRDAFDAVFPQEGK